MAFSIRLLAAAGAVLLIGAAPAKPAARLYTITIRDMAFAPVKLSVHVGDTVQWVNADIFRHSATADDKRFDIDLQPKATGRVVMKRAGRVTFACRYHPTMTGTIDVSG